MIKTQSEKLVIVKLKFMGLWIFTSSATFKRICRVILFIYILHFTNWFTVRVGACSFFFFCGSIPFWFLLLFLLLWKNFLHIDCLFSSPRLFLIFKLISIFPQMFTSSSFSLRLFEIIPNVLWLATPSFTYFTTSFSFSLFFAFTL